MRTRVLIGAALVFSAGCSCGPKLAEESYSLGNSLKVDVVACTRGEKAALSVAYAVGEDQDPPGRSGTAHLIARLLARPGWSTSWGADFVSVSWSGQAD